MATKRCVIYARISVAQEAAVSLERQQEAAEQYAKARGWQVVGVFKDDGISASRNKPEDRAGWRDLLASPLKYDAVIIWKIDRLSRKLLDFLHADEALQERKAGLVGVEDPIDMTTPQGRAFAQILAVFGLMEADAIRARVADARSKLVRAGRVVGGTVPYGWMTVPNPDGPGIVLAHDPDRIDYVRGMAERALRGDTVYSIQQWLGEAGAPLPGTAPVRPEVARRRKPRTRKTDSWSYSTVERLLRNPVLAGMTAFNPGNTTKERGADVLRDGDGLPVVDESVAILSQAEWRALVMKLDDRDSGHTMRRSERAKTSSLLSGLVWCEGCQVRMHRAATENREGYSCPKCHMLITNFESVVVDEFLRQKGERVRWTRVEEVHEGGAALLPEIEHRLDELDRLIRDAADRDTRARLQAEQSNLLDLRDAKREEAPAVSLRYDDAGWFSDAWEQAGEDVEARRAVLDDAMSRIWVRRGRPGRRTDAQVLARLEFDWKVPEDLGAVAV
jgi:site-specific DNA recombinase